MIRVTSQFPDVRCRISFWSALNWEGHKQKVGSVIRWMMTVAEIQCESFKILDLSVRDSKTTGQWIKKEREKCPEVYKPLQVCIWGFRFQRFFAALHVCNDSDLQFSFNVGSTCCRNTLIKANSNNTSLMWAAHPKKRDESDDLWMHECTVMPVKRRDNPQNTHRHQSCERCQMARWLFGANEQSLGLKKTQKRSFVLSKGFGEAARWIVPATGRCLLQLAGGFLFQRWSFIFSQY